MPVLSRLLVAGRSSLGARQTTEVVHLPPQKALAEALHEKAWDNSGSGSSPRPNQRPRRDPASHYSPSGSVPRANPSPEVTDRFCRLPLPTLFYRLEAIHLGDLLRIWVRPGTRLTQSPSDFQGPTRALRTPQEPRCFTGLDVPLAAQRDSRESCPYKEKKTLSGALADVSEFVCVTALDRPRPCYGTGARPRLRAPGSGILTRVPFVIGKLHFYFVQS